MFWDFQIMFHQDNIRFGVIELICEFAIKTQIQKNYAGPGDGTTHR